MGLFLVFFLPCDLAYGALVPQLGDQTHASTGKLSLNHWTAREVPETDPIDLTQRKLSE